MTRIFKHFRIYQPVSSAAVALATLLPALVQCSPEYELLVDGAGSGGRKDGPGQAGTGGAEAAGTGASAAEAATGAGAAPAAGGETGAGAAGGASPLVPCTSPLECGKGSLCGGEGFCIDCFEAQQQTCGARCPSEASLAIVTENECAYCVCEPTVCELHAQCPAASWCSDGKCSPCSTAPASCDDPCPPELERVALRRNGCTVCECASKSECASDPECPSGQICHAGAQCADGCTTPQCCAGNWCGPPD